MPYAGHMRLTMSGVFDSSANGGLLLDEQFSYRINLSDPALSGGYDEAAAADYAADAVAFHSRPTTKISAFAKLTQVKLARIGVDGLYVEDPIVVAVNANGGGGPTFTYPLQVALAVSLVTGLSGATRRGRFYLPAPTTPLDAALGTITPAVRDGVAASVAQFLNDCNNIPGVDFPQTPRVVVASSKGYNSDVTGVRVGLALDTIRSRREGISEAYGAIVPVA